MLTPDKKAKALSRPKRVVRLLSVAGIINKAISIPMEPRLVSRPAWNNSKGALNLNNMI